MSKQDSEKLLQGSVQGRIMERNISVIKDVNGNQIVIVNDIRFKGKRNIDWDEVEQYLKQYVGEFIEIAESKEIIYIGSDLPDEYSGSNYTAKLKGTLAKAKANAAQGIPEMIEIAQNKRFRENLERKHDKNAKYGWYRYDSRFAIPVFDENNDVLRYNIFHAELVIRHSENRKLYLYLLYLNQFHYTFLLTFFPFQHILYKKKRVFYRTALWLKRGARFFFYVYDII